MGTILSVDLLVEIDVCSSELGVGSLAEHHNVPFVRAKIAVQYIPQGGLGFSTFRSLSATAADGILGYTTSWRHIRACPAMLV